MKPLSSAIFLPILIICDFSSDDLQNFISDDDTDEILKIWTDGDCNTDTDDSNEKICVLQEEIRLERLSIFKKKKKNCFPFEITVTLEQIFNLRLNLVFGGHKQDLVCQKIFIQQHLSITYYWTVPLIFDHSYLVGKLTDLKIADTKVPGY